MEEKETLDVSDEAFKWWLESQILSTIEEDLKQILHEQWVIHRTKINEEIGKIKGD